MMRRILLALALALFASGAAAQGMLVSPCGSSFCRNHTLASSPAGLSDPLCAAMSITDAEVGAWCVAVGGANTNATETGILSTMVAGIKADLSITALNQKFDRLSIYATGARPAAKVDLASRVTLTENGAITWTTLKGYTGNGSTMYLDTGLNTSLGGNFTQNSAHFSAWVQALGNNLAFAAYAGVRTGATQAVVLVLGSPVGTADLYGINDAGGGVFAAGAPVVGLRAIDRSDSTHSTAYLSGASSSVNNVTSAALNNKTFLVLANWNTGLTAVANWNNGTVAAFTAGASLGAAGQLAVYTRMHTALNALSAANFP
jgi:hypothetical protein